GHEVRANQVLNKYERLLSKDGRAFLREALDDPNAYEPMLLAEALPEFDIEDICLHGVLMEEDDEDEDDEFAEDLDDWDEDEDADEEEEELPKPGRNDPCLCGSGKKYKKCHLQADEEAELAELEEEGKEDQDPVRTEAFALLAENTDRIRKRRDLMEAGYQFFGDNRPEWANMEAGSEGFLFWYLLDFRPESTGRTAVEELLRKRNSRLEPEILEVLNAWNNTRYGLFEVKSVED